jgi:type II secretion system protein F
MPNYVYTARDRNGVQSSGVISARDVQEVREVLRNKELFLTGIQQQASPSHSRAGLSLLGGRRVPLNDMVVMSRQLATLVRAGLPIVECLHAVAAQTENALLIQTLQQVRMDVLTGSSLADAMRRHPRVFNDLYIALVQAGEAGGVLEETLETAAVQLDREAELREKVKSAFVYPILVLVVATGVVFFLLTFIVPVFARVYEQFRADLPLITRTLIGVSAAISRYGWIFLLAVIAATPLIRRYLQTPGGRLRYDQLKLRLPYFGKLNRKIAISRFTQTLAAVTKAGVPILRALTVSANTSGNQVIVEAVMKAAQFVKDGASLSAPLEQTGQFPPIVTRMIAAGEQSGNLDEMLDQLTRFYHRDVEYTVAKLTRLIEPALTIFVGVVVLFVLLALYMPIFGFGNVIRK